MAAQFILNACFSLYPDLKSFLWNSSSISFFSCCSIYGLVWLWPHQRISMFSSAVVWQLWYCATHAYSTARVIIILHILFPLPTTLPYYPITVLSLSQPSPTLTYPALSYPNLPYPTPPQPNPTQGLHTVFYLREMYCTQGLNMYSQDLHRYMWKYTSEYKIDTVTHKIDMGVHKADIIVNKT